MDGPVNQRPHLIPALASAVLLLVALGDHPYGYYTFLRWVVFMAACLVAWVAWESEVQPATFVFAAVAVLFNPLVPVYLDKSTWAPIDVVCAVLFALSLSLKGKRTPQSVDPAS